MTPSWPRLAGWLATTRPQTLQGIWVRDDPEEGRREAPFAFEAPERWSVDGPQHLLRAHDWERGDYHRAAGLVVEDEHDGRPCWRVGIAPPPHKRGVLDLWVDQEHLLLVRQRNAAFGHDERVTQLLVDAPLPDGAFDEADRRRQELDRDRALYELLQERPPPTPRFLPGRSALRRTGLVELDDGFVARAPVGEQVPVSDWYDEDDVVDVVVDGWHWKVGASPRLTDEEAAQVVARCRPA